MGRNADVHMPQGWVNSLVRRFTLLAMACAMPLAWAQEWPSKPVRVIVAFAPGGPTDILAREITKELQAELGAPFIVDNRGGAGGTIGTAAAAKSAPDGYTLIMTSAVAQAAGPGLWPSVGYDPLKDFTHVSLVARGAIAFMVTADSPYKTFADLIAGAKSKPDSMNFGSGGTGSLGHLTGELAKRVAGVQMQHVPYKGSAPAQADLIGGQIQMVSDVLASHSEMIRTHRMRALAVAAVQRVDAIPDVPTFAELGHKDLVSYSWFGISGPANLPRLVVEKLDKAIQAALKKPSLQARFKSLGMEPTPNIGPAPFTDYVKSEVEKWGGIIKAANIKAQ
jgi:tripartite-type tricarboxylate transporter receptor subunit TctC